MNEPKTEQGANPVSSSQGPDISEGTVYRNSVIISVVWLSVGLVYFGFQHDAFLELRPHEFGTLLQGWAAPVAAIWVIAAVILQRAQLKAQSAEVRQTSEELRRSIEQIQRNVAVTKAKRLMEHLSHALLRLVKMGEDHGCYLYRNEDRLLIGRLFGDHKHYVTLFKAEEYDRVLERVGEGVAEFTDALREEWVLHETVEVVEELCSEFETINRAVAEMRQMAHDLEVLDLRDHGPSPGQLESFYLRVDGAFNTLTSMLESLKCYDDADLNYDGMVKTGGISGSLP